MHPRNIFKIGPPNYEEFARKHPQFRAKCFVGAGGKICMDFHDPEAVRLLAEILLLEYFELNVEIPFGVLVPRIPQRLNYILLIEDLLNKNEFHEQIFGIDIGTAASCIFPLLGATLNNWNFIATDIEQNTIQEAADNIKRNSQTELIQVMLTKPENIFESIFASKTHTDTVFTFTMCNPPFFDPEEAMQKFHCVSSQCLQNSSATDCKKGKAPNSGTTATIKEIAYKGGEVAFIQKMIEESQQFPHKARIYTTMVGKFSSLRTLNNLLIAKQIKHENYTLSQGRTSRWVLAWTFYNNVDLKISF